MAIVSIATLKTYFETGDVPTQAQFENLIDTLSNLSTILGVSGDTGGGLLSSTDTFSTLAIQDTVAYLQYISGLISATSGCTSGDTRMSYANDADGGQVKVDATETILEHSGLLKLNSPIINIAQIPTSSAGLSAGDIWNDSGTLKIV